MNPCDKDHPCASGFECINGVCQVAQKDAVNNKDRLDAVENKDLDIQVDNTDTTSKDVVSREDRLDAIENKDLDIQVDNTDAASKDVVSREDQLDAVENKDLDIQVDNTDAASKDVVSREDQLDAVENKDLDIQVDNTDTTSKDVVSREDQLDAIENKDFDTHDIPATDKYEDTGDVNSNIQDTSNETTDSTGETGHYILTVGQHGTHPDEVGFDQVNGYGNIVPTTVEGKEIILLVGNNHSKNIYLQFEGSERLSGLNTVVIKTSFSEDIDLTWNGTSYKGNNTDFVNHLYANIGNDVQIDSIESAEPETPAYDNAYYIDPESGNDNNDGRTESTAWKTLSKIMSHGPKPGEAFLLKRGSTFKLDRYWDWNGYSGTAEKPIYIDAYGTGDKPKIDVIGKQSLSWVNVGNGMWKAAVPDNPYRIIRDGKELLGSYKYPDEVDGTQYHWYWKDGYLYIKMSDSPANHTIEFSNDLHALMIKNANYVTFRNIEFIGGRSYCVYIWEGSHNVFEHCTIGKYAHKGLQISGDNPVPSYNIVDGCTIDSHYEFDYSNAGTRYGATRRGASEGLLIQNGGRHCEFKNNTIKNWTHACVNLYGSSVDVTYNKIHDNYITAPDLAYGGRIALDGRYCANNEVYNNIIYNIAVRNQFNGHNNHFHHNIVYKVRSSPLKSYPVGQGIGFQAYSASVYNNIIENNLFIDTESEAVSFSANNKNPKTLHNIIVRNNIIYNCGNITSSHIAIVMSTQNISGYSNPSSNTFENNLIYNSTTKMTISWAGRIMTVSSWNGISDTLGTVSNNIAGDPLFVDETNEDYHLRSGSPAIGTGVKPTATKDYDGNTITPPYNIGIYDRPKP